MTVTKVGAHVPRTLGSALGRCTAFRIVFPQASCAPSLKAPKAEQFTFARVWQTQTRSLYCSAPVHAVQQFKLADIGEGIAEVQLTEWFVKEGDSVKEMDNVCAVESDKASVELSSPFTGKVAKLYHKVQDKVKVGEVLMDVDIGGASPSPSQPSQAAQTTTPPKAAASPPQASMGGAATQPFKLADIGEGIAEVQITEWFVKEGDVVKEMDNLCAVESDKASVELTSPYTGKIAKIHAKVQTMAKVGSVLVDIEVAGSAGSAAPAPEAPASPPVASAPTAPSAAGGVQEFKLADIGEGIAEVQVTEWFVKEGDVVKEMDNLCAVESDKASVELTSPYSGKIKKIHYNVQDMVKVGATLVEIETGSISVSTGSPSPPAAAAAAAAAQLPPPQAASSATLAVSSPGIKAPGVLATPKVRGLAKQKGVDLNSVVGTGPSGRVLDSDVLAAVEKAASPAAAATAPTAGSPATPQAALRDVADKVVEISDMVGKGMVKSMVESLSVPYMALGEEIDVTDILALQKVLKDVAVKKYGTKITLTSFFLKAISLAIQENPKVNSKFGPSDASPPCYTQYGKHNISVAIDTPHGLVVPNIKDVGNLSVIEIQQELVRLAKSAMDNKLALGDIKGGTITFSNVGVIGTKDPRPILFDGQAVIGAAGRLMTLPRYNSKGEIVPRQIMNVRWVGDHRHLDGATLARFSNSFKTYMEDPGEWTLTLR